METVLQSTLFNQTIDAKHAYSVWAYFWPCVPFSEQLFWEGQVLLGITNTFDQSVYYYFNTVTVIKQVYITCVLLWETK